MRAGVALEDRTIGRALWLAQRRRGIGGSDAAAILGLSPWETSFSIWLEKTGGAQTKKQVEPDRVVVVRRFSGAGVAAVPASNRTEPMWWGLALEDIVAKRYTEKTGLKVWKPEKLMQHPEHDCLIATPDFLVIGEERGLEIKTANAWADTGWGPEGTDEIPRHYLVQCLHYMAVTGFPVWDIAVLIGGSDFRIYTVRRDAVFEEILISRLTEWWQTYIVQGAQPPIDGSDGASAYLKAFHPADTAPRIPATDAAQILGKELLSLKEQISELEGREGSIVNQLKSLIGDAEGMDGDGWLVTWKAAKPKQAVEWERLSQALMERLQELHQGDMVNLELAKARYSKPGIRTFRLIKKKS